MPQPIKNKVLKKTNTKKTKPVKKRVHPEYGTSKLEKYFEEEFLKKIGVKYIYQFKAESIGRYFDFFCPEANILVEVDGDYWHSYGLTYEQKNPTQKHNEWVDKQKDEWALMRGIPIIRIWEHDIKENPEKVMKILQEAIGKYTEKQNKIKKKKGRH